MMKTYINSIVIACSVLAVSVSLAAAQDTQSSQSTIAVEAGSDFRCRLEKGLRITKPGEPITAKLVEPVYAGTTIAIPEGSTMKGHVSSISNAPRRVGQIALWASQVERQTAEHVYREEEIDTVEGTVRRLLSVDGHLPSRVEQKGDDDRLHELQNQESRLTLKKNREASEKKVDDLLRVIPDIFVYEDQGKHGTLELLAFVPNPAYKPKTYEEAALHAMSGVVLIDLPDKRLAQFSGTLTQYVTFAHGLLGHLAKGGAITVKRVRLSPGQWGTSLFKTDFDGCFAIFKSISKHVDETRSDFEPVPPDTNIRRALEQFVAKSAISSQPTPRDVDRLHESKNAF
jgi:hypothetical protein